MLAVAFASTLLVGRGQDEEPAIDTQPDNSPERFFVEISGRTNPPKVRAIAPIDDANVFFLNQRGQAGVAKFSPGLSLIGWEFYTEVKLNALASLAIGPKYSLITASPEELTQSFDTDQDGQLDFFEALSRDWTGRSEGVRITAGPVADENGRILIALSPYASEEGTAPLARIVAWSPDMGSLVTVMESQLVISSFALGADRLLAARLLMPNYEDGYYVSLTELPPFDPKEPDAAPEYIPQTSPSLLIPAELTRGKPPTQMCFFHEHGREKLLVTCPESQQLIEIVPTKVIDASQATQGWQGSILLRSITDGPVETMVELHPGALLGGGDNGFVPLDINPEVFRITQVNEVTDGIILRFSEEVDRLQSVNPDSYTVKSVSLRGENSTLEVSPVIESDGRTVILKTTELTDGTVLSVVCLNVPSASGKKLLSASVFYTIHQR